MANFNLENYVPVNDRLLLFYKDFPNGRVITELIEHDRETGFVIFKALVFREKEDAEPSTTGFAFEERTQGYVNKTSYIENCETSSVGRALALLGYEITKGIASREEMEKVQRHTDGNLASGRGEIQKAANSPKPPNPVDKPSKLELIKKIETLAKTKNVEVQNIAFGVSKRSNNINELSVAELENALELLRKK